MKTLKSIGAIVVGVISVFVLSFLTDTALEKTGLMKIPFSTNPLWLMIFVTIYRNVFVVISSYITAKLAPNNPIIHSIIFGGIGFVLGIVGTIIMWQEPPHWYPIALVILGIPCAWYGGKLFITRKNQNKTSVN
jgi:uncharacterized protein involved in response to NO